MLRTAEVLKQPRFGVSPVSVHGFLGDAQGCRDFVIPHAHEEANASVAGRKRASMFVRSALTPSPSPLRWARGDFGRAGVEHPGDVRMIHQRQRLSPGFEAGDDGQGKSKTFPGAVMLSTGVPLRVTSRSPSVTVFVEILADGACV